jgi:hypothetical protein
VRADQRNQHVPERRVWADLQQKTFFKVAGAHPRRVKPLNQRQRGVCVVGADGLARILRIFLPHLLQRGRQPPVIVEVPDQKLGKFADLGRAREETELLEQVFLQRLGPRQDVRYGVVDPLTVFGNAV